VIFQTRFVRNGRGAPDVIASALTANAGETGKGDAQQCIADGYSVRRITPRETERLQGFPDDHTNIPGAKDTPRYKALGNSMAVPVMRWIGERIQTVNSIPYATT
jgi:DNA (cytosine-5)-methyltransferase 1